MEINKIAFENLRNIGISQSFEELDVNNDGVINDKDKAEATEEIKNAISNLLSAADDDSEVMIDTSVKKTGSSKASKTGAGKNKYGLTEIDSSNVKDEILNSKGTVYVVIGAIGRCGRCRTYEKNVQSKFDEISKHANVVSLDCDTQSAVRKQIMGDFKISGSTLPFIIKFVDGKPVEQIPYTSNADTMAETLISKAEKGSSGAATPTANEGTTTPAATEGATTPTATEGTTPTAAAAPVKLSDGTDISTSTLEELKTKLDAINKEIEALSAQIEEIQDANDKLLEQKAELEKAQTKAQEEVETATENLKKEEEQLEVYTKEYDNYQEEIEHLNKEILAEQERESEEFKLEMDAAVKDIIKNYNPEKDGDNFETYFAQQMDNVGFPTFTKLNMLNWKSESLSEQAQATLKNIMTQSNVVQNAQAALDAATASLAEITANLATTVENIDKNNKKIETLNADLSVKQKDKTTISDKITELEAAHEAEKKEGKGLSAAEVLALVSEKEKNFAKEKGVNLENCLIMQGADNNWHIYIMDPPKNGAYQSVARYYLGCSKESYDIVPKGSGRIPKSKYSEATDGSGRPAYKLSGVNECWTDAREAEEKSCCYETCSPLSFDVDGNGINTTDETVSFDIDGDGELDTVNNSAEWVLAFDKDHDGIAGEDGSELFGDNTDIDGDGVADGYKDGFEALKALAKKEGLIGENDNKLDEKDIDLLSKKYGLTMTNGYGGEAKSLADLGITEINLAETTETQLTQNYDGKNNDIMRQEGATFVVNGETREYADIWNAKKSADEAVTANSTEKKETASTNLKDAILTLNKHGVVALKGEVNFKAIKDKVENNANIPDEIFDEIVELKEDEEKEIEE